MTKFSKTLNVGSSFFLITQCGKSFNCENDRHRLMKYKLHCKKCEVCTKSDVKYINNDRNIQLQSKEHLLEKTTKKIIEEANRIKEEEEILKELEEQRVLEQLEQEHFEKEKEKLEKEQLEKEKEKRLVCTRCKVNLLIEIHFEKKRNDEYFKTCNNCREYKRNYALKMKEKKTI
eukprot:Lithocolla_globosa_v1_NODE_5029_length_1316_cov_115.649485.p1 type:complete len:175 gc:universal NODE_5029_length_1316_cov_115.649485:589-65(-)